MKKIGLIMFMSFIINVNIIHAECTKEDTNYFKSIEDKYKVSYTFDKDTKTYKMYLSYSDPSAFLYDITGDGIDNATIDMNEENIILSNLASGNYYISIIGVSNSCTDTFKTINLTLPQYNIYSEDPICRGIEEFVLCSPTYDKEIDYNTFISRTNAYKKQKEKEDNQKDDTIQEENKIIKYIEEYYIYVIVSVLLLVVAILLIVKIYNKARQRRRLE